MRVAGNDCVVKPRGWCKVITCICSLFILVGDSGSVDCMGSIEREVEFVAFQICEGVDCNVEIRGVVCKLSVHPIKGASPDVVLGTKDAIVPLLEMVVLLVEDM